MIDEKILKQLTPEKMKKEIEIIQKVKLPLELQKWVREYEKVGRRDKSIWLMIYKSIQVMTFPGVAKKYQKSLINIKFLITMFVILLGDMATVEKNKKLLKGILNIPLEKNYIKLRNANLKKQEYLYLKFSIKIWNHINKIIKKYPRYQEFKDIFRHDIEQILLSINFSFLINKNLYLINKTEYWEYFPHVMQLMIHATSDLMCFPKFNIQELGSLRESILLAQKVARITNWVSTWERELKEKDFSSGIFAYAIDFGILTIDDLKKEDCLEVINKVKRSKIEKKLLEEWGKYYWEIEKFNKKIKSININYLLSRIEKLTIMLLSIKNI